MSKREFKLIALDLDGTLLRSDYKISPRTLDSLSLCHERGMKIIFCTGRRWQKVMSILENVPFPVYCALNNGVVLRSSDSQAPIFTKFLPFEYYRELVSEFRSLELIPIVHIFTDKFDFMVEVNNSEPDKFLADYLVRNEGKYKKVDDLMLYEENNIIQFCVMDDYKVLQPAEERIKSLYGSALNIHVVRNVQYLGCALEVLSREASKYNAAKYVMDLFDISDDEMIAFGDDINDLELLQKAGFGVAMGNALPEVKNIADHVTVSNDKDGIAIELEKFLSSDESP